MAIDKGQTISEDERLQVMRHSTAHVMAEAVLSIFPDAKFGIGPAIEDGFYYDFELPRSLTPDDLPLIRADRERLERVVINLLSNAAKYTHKEGKIEIRVEKSDIPKEIRVSVSDNGIGIAPEHRDKIFERYASSETPEAVKGIGLGLSIAKEVIERHGGRIWVESEANKGSTFTFTLPFHE